MTEAFLRPSTQLINLEKVEMFELFQQHFVGGDFTQFELDLSHKDWVILLREQGMLKGFTALQFYDAQLGDQPIRIVYSGDTITDPSIWPKPAVLAQAWAAAVQQIHQGRSEKLYWLLISSGYRTYRLMSLLYREFYPHYDRPTPPQMTQFMHQLGHRQFQGFYHPDPGLVRFPQPQILRPHLQTIPADKLNDPHVAFFLEKNPGHGQGDELVCLAEVSPTNLTRAGLRLWQSNYPLQ
jgi:hypothetical protein